MLEARHVVPRVTPLRQAGVLLVLAFAVVGCSESSVASLQGRWDGEIRCPGSLREISIAFDISGESIGGEAFITTGAVRVEFDVKGEQVICLRYVRCLDDSCSSDNVCKARHYGDAFPNEGEVVTPGSDEEKALRAALDARYGPGCPVALPIGTPREQQTSSSCSNLGFCEPCLQQQSYRRVLVTLDGPSGAAAKPQLDLSRDGETRLTGTIRNYCADVSQADPQVELEREER